MIVELPLWNFTRYLICLSRIVAMCQNSRTLFRELAASLAIVPSQGWVGRFLNVSDSLSPSVFGLTFKVLSV